MRSYIVPLVISVLTTVITLWEFKYICLFISNSSLKIDAVLSGVFNISAILTGFLLTIYCFIAVSSNSFIEKVQATKTYSEIKKFMLTTTLVTFLSAFCSLIYSAFQFTFSADNFWQAFGMSVWVFFTMLGITFFMSCLHFFMILSNNVPKQPVSGG